MTAGHASTIDKPFVPGAVPERCPSCHNTGLVCDLHPERPFPYGDDEDCSCGGVAALCLTCFPGSSTVR